MISSYAIVRTPQFVSGAKYDPPTPGDYVAYHSARVMGCVYRAPARLFRFSSRKPEAYLRKAVGCRVWVISSELNGSRARYWLEGMFRPEAIRAGQGHSVIEGAGVPLRPHVEITARPWFVELRREQKNFRWGFNRIGDAEIVADLKHCLHGEADGIPAKLEGAAPGPDWRLVEEGRPAEHIAYVRKRDWRLRNLAMEASHGVCAVCRVDYSKVLDGKGVRVLQVHHKRQLGYNDTPRLTRAADLAVVCANC
ncbi:MAG: hypothetical protein ABSH34_26225, partial [Verrucomicrobiota bacterium]